jgi:hypothetical protein
LTTRRKAFYSNEAKQRSFLAFPTGKPASDPTEAGVMLVGSRPYLTASLPVGAGGGGGGGGGLGQQAERPSAAAAKATKVQYFTIFIRAV